MISIEVRPETPEDYAAVRRVHLAAFETAIEADIVDQMRTTAQYRPDLSIIALKDGAIIGHAMFSEVTIVQGEENHTALGLGPIGVLPKYQRQGVGGALIRAGHAQARDAGYPYIVVLGHPEYYPRFGYVPAGQYGLTLPWDVPAEAFMVYELQFGALANAAGAVRYAAPFMDA